MRHPSETGGILFNAKTGNYPSNLRAHTLWACVSPFNELITANLAVQRCRILHGCEDLFRIAFTDHHAETFAQEADL